MKHKIKIEETDEIIDYILTAINNSEGRAFKESIYNNVKNNKGFIEIGLLDTTLLKMQNIGLISETNSNEHVMLDIKAFGYECLRHGGYIKYLEDAYEEKLEPGKFIILGGAFSLVGAIIGGLLPLLNKEDHPKYNQNTYIQYNCVCTKNESVESGKCTSSQKNLICDTILKNKINN